MAGDGGRDQAKLHSEELVEKQGEIIARSVIVYTSVLNCGD